MTASSVGTPTQPLRVAVIGSGPSGFYAAEHLQNQPDLVVQVDMYDRLPTPFGLVRGGVAPDHQKIKSVTRVYDRIATHPEFPPFGEWVKTAPWTPSSPPNSRAKPQTPTSSPSTTVSK